MPYFNGTGPQGAGPMTGRELGPCGGGYSCGRGYGFGRGGGRGFGRGFFGFGRGWSWPWSNSQQPTKQEETDDLKAYIQDLENELKSA